MSKEELLVLNCACHKLEHQVVLELDEDNDLYLSVHLVPERNIIKRMYLAIKYILGYRSKYGEFEEIIVKESDKTKLADIVIKSIHKK